MRVFYKTSITVQRLVPNIYDTEETYSSLGTTKGMVLTISPQDAMISEGNLSQSSTLIADPTLPLKTSDKLTINGETYITRSVKITQPQFGIKVQRAIIEKLNS